MLNMDKHLLRVFFYKALASISFVGKKRYRNHLRVLAYHDVKDSLMFLKQLEYLKAEYNIISLKTVESHIINNEPLPKDSLLITFDDGDYSVLEKGLPIIKSLKIPAILFIITELIGTTKDFWWERVTKSFKVNNHSNLELEKELKHLKCIKNSQRIKELENLKPSFKNQLSLSQLEELMSGGISIANHSDSHPIFNRCTDAEISLELKKSRSFFQTLEYGYYNVFAYPNGNFDQNSESILIKEGIRLAFLFDHKINLKNINPMRISRIRVNSDSPFEEFIAKVSGLHSLVFNKKIAVE